jgi:hypothetical protein
MSIPEENLIGRNTGEEQTVRRESKGGDLDSMRCCNNSNGTPSLRIPELNRVIPGAACETSTVGEKQMDMTS